MIVFIFPYIPLTMKNDTVVSTGLHKKQLYSHMSILKRRAGNQLNFAFMVLKNGFVIFSG